MAGVQLTVTDDRRDDREPVWHLGPGVSVTRPADPSELCLLRGTAYGSVSLHVAGLAVNLLDNARYRRACFEPVPGPSVRFFHHTHEPDGSLDGDLPAPGRGDPVRER